MATSSSSSSEGAVAEAVATEDGWCGVCGSPHSEEGDALVFCDGETCQVAVHQLCYGLNELPPESDPWLCEPCMEAKAARNGQTKDEVVGKEEEKSKCVVCRLPSHPAFAMKRATLLERDQAMKIDKKVRGRGTEINSWVHVTCALWIPETSFIDHDNLEVAIAGDLNKERATLKCELCGLKGQCVQCCKKRCAAAFHPICILRELIGPKQWSLSEARWRKGSSRGLGEVLCSKHYEGAEPAQPTRKKRGRGRAPAEPLVERPKSEYEKERDERIARNASFLESIGLGENSGAKLASSGRKSHKKSDLPPPQQVVVAPMRRSPRERTKNVNYADPGGGILGPRRSPEEVAKEKAELEAKRRRKLLDAADRAVAQASVDDTRYYLRALARDRNEAIRVVHYARLYLDRVDQQRSFDRLQDERRRQAEVALAQQRRIMEIQVAEQRRIHEIHQAERRRQMDASEARRAAELAMREEDRRIREISKDVERAKRAIEKAMLHEKMREEKRLEKARKEDAKAAAKAAKDAELAGQRRAAAAMREGLAEARAREKRVKQGSRATARPDAVASDAKIAELLLLDKAREQGVGAPPRTARRRAWPSRRSCQTNGEVVSPHRAELEKNSATILAEAHRLPPCCFCGERADDPDSAAGSFIQHVFLWPPSDDRPLGALARAHVRCARLSPEVTVDDHGVYYNVLVAAKRGEQNECEGCGRPGATIGCQVPGCGSAYHAPCAVAAYWVFGGQRRFWCPSHRDAFCKKDRYGERFGDPTDNTRVSDVLLGCVSGSFCPKCQKYDPRSEDDYVGCDGCRAWWHLACAGVEDVSSLSPEEPWYCPTCIEESRELQQTTLCVCGATSADCVNEQMLLCEACDVWHHPRCVGLDAAEFARLSASTDPWFCPACRAKGLVCTCRRPPKDDERLVACSQCANLFHPLCVGLEPHEAAAYCGEQSTRLFICPSCYAREKEERGRRQRRAKRRRIEQQQQQQQQQQLGQDNIPPDHQQPPPQDEMHPSSTSSLQQDKHDDQRPLMGDALAFLDDDDDDDDDGGGGGGALRALVPTVAPSPECSVESPHNAHQFHHQQHHEHQEQQQQQQQQHHQEQQYYHQRQQQARLKPSSFSPAMFADENALGPQPPQQLVDKGRKRRAPTSVPAANNHYFPTSVEHERGYHHQQQGTSMLMVGYPSQPQRQPQMAMPAYQPSAEPMQRSQHAASMSRRGRRNNAYHAQQAGQQAMSMEALPHNDFLFGFDGESPNAIGAHAAFLQAAAPDFHRPPAVRVVPSSTGPNGHPQAMVRDQTPHHQSSRNDYAVDLSMQMGTAPRDPNEMPRRPTNGPLAQPPPRHAFVQVQVGHHAGVAMASSPFPNMAAAGMLQHPYVEPYV
ncbi:hypothetical protein CTAYLR_005237 [Chrysophaeum taylorii]|uniref:Uncharacterized protein n=1 Tax=Chrysophaeum taylorii TaxID=2483200 RepID=A0AAD7UD54_9STRA|nr:hypothetical protein CTAYLR_005237 [Chrysophaeum taylorii]